MDERGIVTPQFAVQHMGFDVADIAQVARHGNKQHGGVAHTAGQVDVQRIAGLHLLYNVVYGGGLGALAHSVGNGNGHKVLRRKICLLQGGLGEIVQGG